MDWDELGNELEKIAEAPDSRYRVAEYTQILSGFDAGQEGRAEVLACLADELKGHGDLDGAEATYERAIEDGGRTVLSPYAGLLDIALQRGDDQRTDDLLDTLIALSREDALVVGDYEWIAESLEEAGRHRAALRWFTIPLRDIQPGDIDLMPIDCLTGRYRVRRMLELPVDAYDDAYEVLQEQSDA
jgi:tetratricopeptide (TPR) repeat protein